VYELRGQLDEAEAAYQRATVLPRGAFAFIALGRFYLHGGRDLPKAATALTEALRRIRAAEPLIRLELARLQLACDRPVAALAQVERALDCRRDTGFPDELGIGQRIEALRDRSDTPAPPDRPLPPELALLDDAALEVPGPERLLGI